MDSEPKPVTRAAPDARVERIPAFRLTPADDIQAAESSSLVERFKHLSWSRYFCLVRVGRHPGGLVNRKGEERESHVREVLEAGLAAIEAEMEEIRRELYCRRARVPAERPFRSSRNGQRGRHHST